MSDVFARSAAAFEDCSTHLAATKTSGSEIEFYLTQHLLVILFAEVENSLHAIVGERAGAIQDGKLAAYCAGAAKKLIRSVRKEELATAVGLFGETCKKAFNQALEDQLVTAYSNAVTSRHSVAHRSGAQMTLSEFKLAMDAAEIVLKAFREAIS